MAGNVKVFDGGRDVTRKCQIVFSDDINYPKANVSLDASGWVFTHVAAGRTFLSYVECDLAMARRRYYTRALGFDVDAPDLATYFGHVEVEIDPTGPNFRRTAEQLADAPPAVAGGGVVTTAAVQLLTIAFAKAVVAGQGEGPRTLGYGQSIGAADGIKAVKQAYATRYQEPLSLPVSASLVSQASSSEPRVIRKGSLAFAHADLAGFDLVWLGAVKAGKGQLALRFVRTDGPPELATCEQVEVSADDRQVSVPLAPQTGRTPSVQGLVDAELVTSMLAAKATRLTLCGVTRRLNDAGVKAGKALFSLYEIMLTEQPSGAASTPEGADAESSDTIRLPPFPATSGAATSAAGDAP